MKNTTKNKKLIYRQIVLSKDEMDKFEKKRIKKEVQIVKKASLIG